MICILQVQSNLHVGNNPTPATAEVPAVWPLVCPEPYPIEPLPDEHPSKRPRLELEIPNVVSSRP